MTGNAIVNWFLASSLASLVVVIAVALFAYCVWDGWGRYRKMLREAEKAKRER
jgi:uncharacterized membrane protein YedE/YeeE